MKYTFNVILIVGLMVVASLQRTESLSMDLEIQQPDGTVLSIEDTSSLNQVEMVLKASFEANRSYQDEILGVIYIPGIVLDVIMESSDNEYYLKHDKNDKPNKKGELFASKRSLNELSDMSLIYGHNNADGSKFGRLALSLTSNDSSRTLYFYDGKTLKEYKLRFAFDFMDGTEVLERKDLSEINRELFLNSLEKQSRYVSPNFNSNFNEIVFLQTCLRAYGDERVVFAYELISQGDL